MSGVQITPPFQVFTDTDGTPLENGFIFIGEANLNAEVYPVPLFFDAALTIPAAQPVRTLGGYPSRAGTPTRLYTSEITYSITVKNSRGEFVYSALNSTSPTELDSRLSDTTNPLNGAALIGRGGQCVDSIAALRLLSKNSPSQHAFVFGYESRGDGGGGPYAIDPLDTLSADNGGTIIVAADGARWKLKHNGIVYVEQFGCLAIPSRNNFSFLQAAVSIAYTEDFELRAGSGTFEYGTTLDLSYPTLVFRGSGFRNTVFKFTGTGIGMRADGDRPNNGAFSFDIDLSDFTIEGNANCTIPLRVRINHARVKNINVREANSSTGIGIKVEGVVAGHWENITCSTNTQLMTNRPLRGMVFDEDPTDTRRATDNTVINCTMEGALEDGIQIVKGDFTTFIGGTSENNAGVGVHIFPDSKDNTFIGMCFENGGFADVFDDGECNKFLNCYGTKGMNIGPNAQFHKTDGGFWQYVFEDIAAEYSTIENLRYNFLVSPIGTFVLNSGTWSTRNIFNVQGAAYFVPKKPIVSPPLGATPSTFTNTTGVALDFYVQGGTVSAIDLTRSGSVIPVPVEGEYYLAPGDQITIAYTVAPNIRYARNGSNYS